MNKDEARAAVWTMFTALTHEWKKQERGVHDGLLSDAHTRVERALDAFERAVKAEMPCYSGWRTKDCDDATDYKCLSCKAREVKDV